MNPYPKNESFYAFVNGGEFVQWSVMDNNTLFVLTIPGHSLMFGPGTWKFKKTLFGNGKILVSFTHANSRIEFHLRICPIDERDGNEAMFWAGSNGPLNTGRFRLSEIFGREKVILAFDN